MFLFILHHKGCQGLPWAIWQQLYNLKRTSDNWQEGLFLGEKKTSDSRPDLASCCNQCYKCYVIVTPSPTETGESTHENITRMMQKVLAVFSQLIVFVFFFLLQTKHILCLPRPPSCCWLVTVHLWTFTMFCQSMKPKSFLHFDLTWDRRLLVINIVDKRPAKENNTPDHHWKKIITKGTYIFIFQLVGAFIFWRQQAALQSMAIRKPIAWTLSSWDSVGLTHLLKTKMEILLASLFFIRFWGRTGTMANHSSKAGVTRALADPVSAQKC